MGIRHLDTGEYEVVPVSTAATYQQVWLPACAQLGLKWVAHFHDGSLTTVPSELIPQIVAELRQLRGWASESPELEFMVERIDTILCIFRETDPALCVYDFG
jgi:hypothetical protein